MKLGTEEKTKVKWLIGLAVVAAIAFYTQVLSDSPSSPAPKSVVGERNQAAEIPGADPAGSSRASLPESTPRTAPRRANTDEFRPAFRSKRPEDRIDPVNIDPTIRWDLLAKVQDVKLEGATRNLFQFGAAPAPKLEGPETIVAVKPKVFDYPRPLPPPPPPAAEPPPPPEPPIDVKYYGVATRKINGKQTAFFLDGDTIILAPEGGVVKKKYRVVRIGLTTVVMENIDNKKQQSLQLAEDAGANLGN